MKILLALLATTLSLAPLRATEPECVVLLHGFAMGSWAMGRLASSLRQAGYRVVNLDYPSRKLPIEKIAGEFLPAKLAAADIARAPRVHFVTHSMGGLVVRLYLRDRAPANLGRVVMLGPPNHGSVAADKMNRVKLWRAYGGTNLAKLGTAGESIAATLGPANFELGIVAGNSSVNPLYSKWLQAPNDGAVTVESTRLEGMADFIVVPHSHTVMLWRRAVIDQVKAFLRTGKFAPSPPPPA